MLSIIFSPSIGISKTNFKYEFEGQIIKATYGEEVDIFDFSSLPDGITFPWDIQTNLPINPILAAEKVSGILFLELLNYITEDATEFEKFPNPIEVGEE